MIGTCPMASTKAIRQQDALIRINGSTGNVTVQCDIPCWSNVSVVNSSVQCQSKIEPTCDYWDESSKSWKGDGCFVKAFTPWNTTCECTHLTSFASKSGAVGDEAL